MRSHRHIGRAGSVAIALPLAVRRSTVLGVMAFDYPVFSGLSRPILPISSAYGETETGLAELFNKFYAGSFTCAVNILPVTDSTPLKRHTTLLCSLAELNSGTSPERARELSLKVHGQSIAQVRQFGTHLEFNDGSMLARSITEGARQHLTARVIFWILERHTAMPDWLEYDLLRFVQYDFSQRRRCLPELIESHCLAHEFMIHADASLITTSPAVQEAQLAEALEAAEQYARAALLYAEAAIASEALHGLNTDVSTSTMNAGVAWRRAGNAKKAEEAYVLAMHKFVKMFPTLSGAALVHHEFIGCLLDNLRTAYDQCLVDKGMRGANLSNRVVDPMTDEVIPHVCCALEALMAAAGVEKYRHRKACVVDKSALRKPRRKDAIATLFSAIKSGPSVLDFRCVILDSICRDMTGVECPDVQVPSPRENMSKACDVVKTTGGKANQYSWCGGCDKPMAEAGSCPCKQVSYCSKDCQRLHWPTHKLVCPLRKPKPTAAADAQLIEPLAIS